MFGRIALASFASALIAVLLGAGINAARYQDAAALTNCTTSTMGLGPAEQQLLTLINNFRQLNGVPPVAASPNLSRAAAWMSEDQSSNGTFSHTDSLGRSPFTRVQHCGYPSSGAGENLARTSSAQSAFNLWLGSTAGHKENMLRASWTVVGIGQAGAIWTADFGGLNDSSQPWDSGPPPPPPATGTPTQRPIIISNPTATSPTAGAASPTPTPTPTPTASPTPPPLLPRVTLQMISAE